MSDDAQSETFPRRSLPDDGARRLEIALLKLYIRRHGTDTAKKFIREIEQEKGKDGKTTNDEKMSIASKMATK